MRRVFSVAAGAILALAISAGAASAASSYKLVTFGTGTVTTSDRSATIVNDAGEYGGVYIKSKTYSGKALSTVDFEFRSTGDVGGGAPRLSIPIDDPATAAKLDGYAFLDVINCGGDGTTPTLVSTEAGNCLVYFGTDVYANWDAFAAANPTYKVASGYLAFIIADVEGSYAVDHIYLNR